MRDKNGTNMGIVTNAGGPVGMAADALGRWGAEPGVLAPETLRQLEEILPRHWSGSNPIDTMGDASPERYLQVVRLTTA